MKKKIVIAVFLFVFLSLFAGRYAGDFMEIGSGVRSLSMGGAYASIADDGSAIYWNPAGIAQIRDLEVSLMHADLYDGLASYDSFTYCQPLPNNVSIGIGWTRLTIDGIPEFSETHLVGTNVDIRSADPDLHLTGIPDSEFKSFDDLFQFSFAKQLNYEADLGWGFFKVPFQVNMGGNVKFIRRTLQDNYGTGSGFDIGLLIKSDLSVLMDREWLGKIGFGVNLQNVSGTDITWDTSSNHKDEVLYNTKMGINIEQPIPKWKSSLIIAYDKDYLYDKPYHLGLELDYNKYIQVRGGYTANNVTTGMSIKVYSFYIDYGFITNSIGNTNRLGLRFIF
ncbi:MAG: hypothetical protein JXR56_09395 [Candidatus Cloacimonetes bacterium]|nr:hypothetical protein [Candidatus Cloacimonadota bacterium]